MARAWKVTGLRPEMSLRTVARRVLGVRIAEVYSFAPFIHDPARVTDLHNMRISAKRLRYTLEIFRSCYPPPVENLLDQVKGLQELLGEIHDADVLVPVLQERLASIAAEEDAVLLAQLHAEDNEAARLAAIQAALAPRPNDRRVGIAALLGRTLHRRRQRYAQFLDLWTRLETGGFRQQLEGLIRPPSAGRASPKPASNAAALLASAAG